MNMAFTTGALFILQCIFLMDISVADPLITVSPSEINLGITSTLDINCTFSLDNHPDIAGIISLVLSRANATGQQFENLATITQFTPTSVNLLSQEKISATGVHSQTGESFLQLSWQYPTALQGGVYKCSANGVGVLGLNVEMTHTSSVTVDEANLNDIFEKLQQLEMHKTSVTNTIYTMENQIQTLETDKTAMEQRIETLETDKTAMEQRIQKLETDKTSTEQRIETLETDKTAMEQRIQTLETDKTAMEQRIETLETDKTAMEQRIQTLETKTQTMESDKLSIGHNISRLEVVISSMGRLHVNLLGRHGTKDYYLSGYAFTDINNAIDVCKSLGGQLTVVNDQNELTAIQGFLKATSGIDNVYISGSDENTEGNWVLSESNTQLPFMSWYTDRPLTHRGRNCLMLVSNSWTMYDYPCHFDLPYDYIRFLCEV